MKQAQKENKLHHASRQTVPMERREALLFAETAHAEFAADAIRADDTDIRTGKRLKPGGRG